MQIGDIHGDGADWALDAIDATVRVRASQPDGAPIFIGIASEQAVDRYLTQVAHDEVSDVHSGPFTYDSVRRGGSATPGVPANASFWAATATGPGTQALTWKPDVGRWAVVVMNADGSRRVAADVSVGAKTGVLLPVGIGLFALSLLVVIGAAALIAARDPRALGGPGDHDRPGVVWCSTPVETLPSSVAASVLRPREPRTIAAASSSSAQPTIAANTAPALRMTFGSASNPAAAASSQPSAAIASASSRVAVSMSSTASLTIALGRAISAAAAAVSSVGQAVTTTAGPGRSRLPACWIAARAWCEPSKANRTGPDSDMRAS